jgi:LCP family protein required for cell wall assembly
MGVAKAGPAMSRTVGRALKVEIDNYVVIGFEGVKRLVNAVGGVDIVLPETIRDSAYWLSPTKRGVVFPAGKNHLNGERALIFARTRKADNDFERARRQQKLIAAAVASVRELGLGDLPELVAIARDYVKTDLPLARAPEIFEIVASAKTKKATGVVFGPRKWASSTGGASFALKIGEVRGWTRKWMAPVKAAPDATSTPAASTAP